MGPFSQQHVPVTQLSCFLVFISPLNEGSILRLMLQMLWPGFIYSLSWLKQSWGGGGGGVGGCLQSTSADVPTFHPFLRLLLFTDLFFVAASPRALWVSRPPGSPGLTTAPITWCILEAFILLRQLALEGNIQNILYRPTEL